MTKENVQLTIVLPCLNEVESMATIIQNIRSAGWTKEKAEIIVVDDGSTDGTKENLQLISENDGNIKLVFPQNRLGLAKSIERGISLASAQHLAVMDTDGMHNPVYLSVMYQLSKTHKSLVIGSRYATGGSSQGAIYPHISKVVNFIIQKLMKSKTKDQLCGFFVCETSEILKVPSRKFKGFGEYFIGVIQSFETRGIEVEEFPTAHNVRNAGIRKSRRFRMLRTYLQYVLEERRN